MQSVKTFRFWLRSLSTLDNEFKFCILFPWSIFNGPINSEKIISKKAIKYLYHVGNTESLSQI
jgi:hypothetical protein